MARRASELETVLAFQMRALRLPVPESEYRWHSARQWRFDFAWPALALAVEVEGGTYKAGRHVRPGGFAKDCEKYNAAALDGWRVLRFESKAIMNGSAANLIEKAIRKALK